MATLGAPTRLAAWHGELFHSHQNSIFNARTFFQVGGVKPSRRNSYGGRLTGALGKSTWLTANVSQQKIRGMVNGNVLVPLAGERNALTDDPALRPLVQRFLNAYLTSAPSTPTRRSASTTPTSASVSITTSAAVASSPLRTNSPASMSTPFS